MSTMSTGIPRRYDERSLAGNAQVSKTSVAFRDFSNSSLVAPFSSVVAVNKHPFSTFGDRGYFGARARADRSGKLAPRLLSCVSGAQGVAGARLDVKRSSRGADAVQIQASM
jgi:hypothetical protein